MTQEDKHLLLQDLCARLPYGVKALINGWEGIIKIHDISDFNEGIKTIKPYLRPMSSMTEEEKKEVSILLNYEFYVDEDCALVAEDDRHRIRLDLMQVYIDWLNANHFDYRGLIEKGLALEASNTK